MVSHKHRRDFNYFLNKIEIESNLLEINYRVIKHLQ